MKIIEQSYEILRATNLVEDIECAGRLAYKTEDKIADESAAKFVTRIINQGHWPVLDMGSVTMLFDMRDEDLRFFHEIAGWAGGKYTFFDELSKGKSPGSKWCMWTGSPRALTEYLNKTWEYALMQEFSCFLYEYDPICFSGLRHTVRTRPEHIHITPIESPYNIFSPEYVQKRHQHVGVRFITNRAVTHEMVRHRPCGFIQESQRYCRYADDKFGNEVTFIKPIAFKFWNKSGDAYLAWMGACESSEERYFTMLNDGCTPQAARTVLPNSCKTEIIVFTNLLEWEHIFRLRTKKGAEPSMIEAMTPVCEEMCDVYPIIDVETKAYA